MNEIKNNWFGDSGPFFHNSFLIFGTALIFFALPGCKTSSTVVAPAGAIVVKNEAEFIRAIRPGARIHLRKGVYLLTKASGSTTPYVSWEETFDGPEMHINQVANLVITAEPGATVLASPRYAWVMQFNQCAQISISGLVIGHTEEGYCVGGVVSFVQSAQIELKDCRLYGSGTEGIRIEASSKFTGDNLTVTECTYDLMTILAATEVSFTNCSFTKTGEFDLVVVESTPLVSFENCNFSQNFNRSDFMPYFFQLGEGAGKVTLSKCRFENNNVGKWSNAPERISRSQCIFRGNTFQDFTDTELSAP